MDFLARLASRQVHLGRGILPRIPPRYEATEVGTAGRASHDLQKPDAHARPHEGEDVPLDGSTKATEISGRVARLIGNRSGDLVAGANSPSKRNLAKRRTATGRADAEAGADLPEARGAVQLEEGSRPEAGAMASEPEGRRVATGFGRSTVKVSDPGQGHASDAQVPSAMTRVARRRASGEGLDHSVEASLLVPINLEPAGPAISPRHGRGFDVAENVGSGGDHPSVTVTIGRIEVRAPRDTHTPQAASKSSRSRSAPSLDEYLERRHGGARK